MFQLNPKSNQCEFPKFLKVEGRENSETKALQEIHLDGNALHSYSSAAARTSIISPQNIVDPYPPTKNASFKTLKPYFSVTFVENFDIVFKFHFHFVRLASSINLTLHT